MTAAYNLAAALRTRSENGASVTIVNVPREIGAVADFFVNRAYNASLRYALAWNRVSVALAFRMGSEKLERFAWTPSKGLHRLYRGADALVLCTPWLVDSLLAGKGLLPPTWSVVLDLAPPLSPGWDAKGVDHVIAPTEDAEAALRGRTVVLGMPVFPGSATAPDSRCSDCDRAPHVLLVAGREGGGRVLQVAKGLAANRDWHLTVHAGMDPHLVRRVRVLAQRSVAHVVVRPFEDPLLPSIASHDVVVTKPGALTVSEALAYGKALVLDGCRGLMEQERGNAAFVTGRGAGRLGRSPAAIVRQVSEVTEDSRFAASARLLVSIAAVNRIADAILQGIHQEPIAWLPS